MFERILAVRYIRGQKRHSVLTICSIAIALALMTLLFTGFSTLTGIRRDKAYDDAPYHVKILRLTQEEFDTLAACPDFTKCERVVEEDYTVSAELMLRGYHENLGEFLSGILPEKGIYDGLWNFKVVELNYDLIRYDRIELSGRTSFLTTVTLFYAFVMFLILTLRLVIDTAFEVSAKERERQFGVLQSIGATPGQVVRVITFEGLLLCVIGIPAGILLGLGLSVAALEAVLSSGIGEIYVTPEKAAALLHLHISPLYLTIGAVTGLVWVLLSAYATGMRIIRMSPIEAITGKHAKVKKVRRHSLFGLLFGWKGRLASRNNRRQPKRFFITVLSLTLSLMLFSSFSVVLGSVQDTFEAALTANGIDFDLELGFPTDEDDPLSYHESYDAIRNSGYFDIVDYTKTRLVNHSLTDGTSATGIVMYCDPETYRMQFEGEPPLSYDELSAGNRYILCAPAYAGEEGAAFRMKEMTEIPVTFPFNRKLTAEEYEAMSEEERQNVLESTVYYSDTGEERLRYRYVREEGQAIAPIAAFGRARPRLPEEMYDTSYLNQYFCLIGTLDRYDAGEFDTFGTGIFSGGYETIQVNLKNPDEYKAAMDWVEAADGVDVSADFFGERTELRTTLAAIRIGCGFLSVLIGLIAVVNLVNILSTSLLNRKRELAAMQCIGMTRGQLYGMTVIECLQYVLTAAVGALLLTEGLIFATEMMLRATALIEDKGSFIQYDAPLPMIALSSLAAMLAALAASLIPLGTMQRDSLTDQIRSVE